MSTFMLFYLRTQQNKYSKFEINILNANSSHVVSVILQSIVQEIKPQRQTQID